MKIEQGTPIRAAARQGDVWHVGGRYLDASGGGCTVASIAEKMIDWDAVGEIRVRVRVWREAETSLRLVHPMDNGMIGNDPAFFVETLDVTDADGVPLARLSLSEAISQDPTLTLLPDAPASGGVLKVSARDNNGGLFRAEVPIPPAKAAGLREDRL